MLITKFHWCLTPVMLICCFLSFSCARKFRYNFSYKAFLNLSKPRKISPTWIRVKVSGVPVSHAGEAEGYSLLRLVLVALVNTRGDFFIGVTESRGRLRSLPQRGVRKRICGLPFTLTPPLAVNEGVPEYSKLGDSNTACNTSTLIKA